jgi:hypothetical protein
VSANKVALKANDTMLPDAFKNGDVKKINYESAGRDKAHYLYNGL